jgi:hypothetical protein
MIYLRAIVKEINMAVDAYFATLLAFQKRALWNICTSARGEVGGTEVVAPYYFNADGEGIFVGPDDQFDFIAYHRANGLVVFPSQGQFGNGLQSLGLTASMSMTVFYNQKVICMSPDEIALILMAKIIVPANIENVKGIFINLDSVSFDKETIFASEYRALPYTLSAEQQLLRINYTLEGTFRKDCLNIC